jgi:hypothetical protein
MPWLPPSFHLTPLDFSSCGFDKGKMYLPLLPANVDDLRAIITDAVAEVRTDMLRLTW